MRQNRIILAALLLIAGLSVTQGCTSGKKAEAGSQPAAAPVTVAKSEQRDVPVTINAIGNVTPLSTVQVRAMVTAPVLGVHVKPGDFVRKGQLLFTLDPRTFEADLSKAQGQLAKDRAAAANALQQAKRYGALFQQGVISRDQNETVQSAAQQAQATIEADQAAVDAAKVNLQYTKIYSPINGRAGDILVYPGNIIKAQDASLLVLNEVTPIYANFTVPERSLPELRKHMADNTLKVEARFPDEAQAPAAGKFTFVNNAVDTTTGTIALKATFANQDHRLWPGQFVNVVITLSVEKNAVVVPLQAVQTGQKGPFLYVLKDDQTVELRQLALGAQVGNMQVIRSGVAAGETVVTDGQMRLAPGTKAQVKQASAVDPQQQSTAPMPGGSE